MSKPKRFKFVIDMDTPWAQRWMLKRLGITIEQARAKVIGGSNIKYLNMPAIPRNADPLAGFKFHAFMIKVR